MTKHLRLKLYEGLGLALAQVQGGLSDLGKDLVLKGSPEELLCRCQEIIRRVMGAMDDGHMAGVHVQAVVSKGSLQCTHMVFEDRFYDRHLGGEGNLWLVIFRRDLHLELAENFWLKLYEGLGLALAQVQGGLSDLGKDLVLKGSPEELLCRCEKGRGPFAGVKIGEEITAFAVMSRDLQCLFQDFGHVMGQKVLIGGVTDHRRLCLHPKDRNLISQVFESVFCHPHVGRE
ncbi:MAG: hypothetical protein SWE60_00250 [Thermodesulfobacteriota bacterium]|nr:hypothetical protein [Thermodesulfobacteriota bacterium]